MNTSDILSKIKISKRLTLSICVVLAPIVVLVTVENVRMINLIRNLNSNNPAPIRSDALSYLLIEEKGYVPSYVLRAVARAMNDDDQIIEGGCYSVLSSRISRWKEFAPIVVDNIGTYDLVTSDSMRLFRKVGQPAVSYLRTELLKGRYLHSNNKKEKEIINQLIASIEKDLSIESLN